MSMVRLSHPECAMTSAEKELGTWSHPLTAVPPSCQIFLRRFSLILGPLPPRLGCPRVASHAQIHPRTRRRSPPVRLSSRRYRSLLRDPRHVPKDTSEPAMRARVAARYGAVEPASTLHGSSGAICLVRGWAEIVARRSTSQGAQLAKPGKSKREIIHCLKHYV